jgi:anti-sigma-K factor RskA
MSTGDDHLADDGGDDLLAAEYVLGTLPGAERLSVAARIESEPAFARLVDLWEVRLSPLGESYDTLQPPPAVKAALDRRLFSGSQAGAKSPAPSAGGLWASLAFWRSLAVAAIAALAVAVALQFAVPPAGQPPLRLVASLAADGSDVKYLVLYDPGKADISLSHVSGERAAGHDFELWMIEGDKAPVSMGIIPVGAATHLVVGPAEKAKLAQGAVLAVSLEPAGGSPTGQPTGPVVAAGDLRDI